MATDQWKIEKDNSAVCVQTRLLVSVDTHSANSERAPCLSAVVLYLYLTQYFP